MDTKKFEERLRDGLSFAECIHLAIADAQTVEEKEAIVSAFAKLVLSKKAPPSE